MVQADRTANRHRYSGRVDQGVRVILRQGTRQYSDRNLGIRSSSSSFGAILYAMFYIYLLQNSKSGQIYIGYSSDLRTRVKAHNAKGKKFTTTTNGVWTLKYYEAYASKEDAMARERKLKQHGSGKHQLLKRLQSLKPKTGAGRS